VPFRAGRAPPLRGQPLRFQVFRKIRDYLRDGRRRGERSRARARLETPCDSTAWVRGDEAIAMKIATAVR
jgi:hypothetical protein